MGHNQSDGQPYRCIVCGGRTAIETGHYRIGDARIHSDCIWSFWHPPLTEDADWIQQRSNAAMERAHMTAKQSAQLRDQADVLKTESEVTMEKVKQVKRGNRR